MLMTTWLAVLQVITVGLVSAPWLRSITRNILMPAAQSPTLIHEYSTVYTRLQQGKRELIGFGADRVLVNRYVLDSADSTNPCDPEPVLGSIAIDKVTEGDSAEERMLYCRHTLAGLVGMQEEVNTLQKVAREKGISAGLLTIVGQASVHSPEDNGASVIYQLNQLLNPSIDDTGPSNQSVTPAENTVAIGSADSAIDHAANDALSMDFERLTTLQKITTTVLEHKTALIIDVVVCFFASCLAISLVS